MLYPNRLINLNNKGTNKPLSTCDSLLFTRAASAVRYIYYTWVLWWSANTPPSGEPVTARLPTYQGETISVCLTAPGSFARPEETQTAAMIQKSIVNASSFTTYPSSHSTRPCLITFSYQRPCHFCHSPV